MRRLALIAGALLMLGAASPPRVAVTGGTVEGVATGDALVFRGIPFAAPPTGENRWRAPQPVAAWHGVRAATRAAPACIQNDYGWNRSFYITSSEDCLTLDVRTPSLEGKRPVMVWIHGGSNYAGGAAGTVESRITDKGVVLVAIQYRLGVLGFLSHRGLAKEQGGTSGNYGLMDQIAALKWVQANIARFGGDPGNVTIFGESAGSQDVSLLLASPETKGLFERAIMESGSPGFGLPFRSLDQAFRLGDQLDAQMESGGDIEKLRHASIAALLAADLKLVDPGVQTHGFLWLHTTIDGKVLPRDPRQLYDEGPKRPAIVGTNRAEFGIDGGRPHRDAAVDAAFGANAAKARAFYGLDRPDPPADPRLGDRDLMIGTDIIFRCPANRTAEAIATSGAPVWRYQFDLAQGGGISSHTSEIPYVMDGLPITPGVTLQDYWVDFAKTGDPNGGGLPEWPRFTADAQRYFEIDKGGVHAADHLRAEPCQWMDQL
ncbi:MAG TPA: carboxylesterase family protein [Sphingomonas sp.]|nr:carboxylesterase family protein [Sphingomonas sp.]